MMMMATSDKESNPVSRIHEKTISFDSLLPPTSSDNSTDDEVILRQHEGAQPAANASSLSSARTPPRKLRKAIRATRAQPQDVESYNTSSQRAPVRLKDVLKIFLCTKEDFTEISPEQVNRVKMMHERIEDGANFSFNYNVLLLVSSVIAGLGLVSDNSTSIIASMLVSPIMGPVVGLAYGTIIQDWKLVRKSLQNECISLFVCIHIGVVIACCTGPTNLSDDWPTYEMASRGSKQNFLVALPIAFFSGLGVAVSLLDDQTASLVGVAISASLLPPAVNAGIVWIAYLFAHTNVINLHDYGYDEDIEIQLRKEDYRQMGFMSLAVTLSNIALIWISSMLMFRVKEVLPIKKKVFWEDLGVARKIYQNRALLQTHTATSAANMPSPTSDSPVEK